jgi:hypothetical protein
MDEYFGTSYSTGRKKARGSVAFSSYMEEPYHVKEWYPRQAPQPISFGSGDVEANPEIEVEPNEQVHERPHGRVFHARNRREPVVEPVVEQEDEEEEDEDVQERERPRRKPNRLLLNAARATRDLAVGAASLAEQGVTNAASLAGKGLSGAASLAGRGLIGAGTLVGRGIQGAADHIEKAILENRAFMEQEEQERKEIEQRIRAEKIERARIQKIEEEIRERIRQEELGLFGQTREFLESLGIIKKGSASVRERSPPPVRERSPPPVRERSPPSVRERSPPPVRERFLPVREVPRLQRIPQIVEHVRRPEPRQYSRLGAVKRTTPVENFEALEPRPQQMNREQMNQAAGGGMTDQQRLTSQGVDVSKLVFRADGMLNKKFKVQNAGYL